jgi:hypothetical protein
MAKRMRLVVTTVGSHGIPQQTIGQGFTDGGECGARTARRATQAKFVSIVSLRVETSEHASALATIGSTQQLGSPLWQYDNSGFKSKIPRLYQMLTTVGSHLLSAGSLVPRAVVTIATAFRFVQADARSFGKPVHWPGIAGRIRRRPSLALRRHVYESSFSSSRSVVVFLHCY